MNFTLESVGLSKDELQSRVVNRISEELLTTINIDEDGDEWMGGSELGKKLQKVVQEKIDNAVMAMADKYVLPNVDEYIEKLTLQETNKWGEQRGKKLTFVEYLVERAEAYLVEKVDYSGKAKSERDGYSWNGTQTRIAHMIHKHLHYNIEQAMENAVSSANSAISQGIQETVKIKLAEISTKLKTTVTIK